MYAITHEARQKSCETRVFENLNFFTYSFCEFNNIIGTDIVSCLRSSQGSEKYERITILQVSYVILQIKVPGVYDFCQFFEGTFIRVSVYCKTEFCR